MNLQIDSLLNTHLEPQSLTVELSSEKKLPGFQIIGLASTEISESRQRIRSAFSAAGQKFPGKKITINLSPAGIRKQGTGLELAIATVILASTDSAMQQRFRSWGKIAAWGELSLNGRVRPVGQVTRLIYAAKKYSWQALILAREDYEQLCHNLQTYFESHSFPCKIIPVDHLNQVAKLFNQNALPETNLLPIKAKDITPQRPLTLLPPHPQIMRALTVAAIGQHHMLLLGPAGIGKTQALHWRAFLEPPADREHVIIQKLALELMEAEEKTATSLLNSNAAQKIKRHLGSQVHVRSLTGSFHRQLLPGEYTLAHGGLLLADELPEWPRDARESLRQPLEEKIIHLHHTRHRQELPADFTLMATGNPCPCGMPSEQCRCPGAEKIRYRQRLSGPILDRIDLCLEIQREKNKNHGVSTTLSPLTVCEEIVCYRRKAEKLWGHCPAKIPQTDLELLYKKVVMPAYLQNTAALSYRHRHKVMRLALTLSLMAKKDQPEAAEWLEAALYRNAFQQSQ